LWGLLREGIFVETMNELMSKAVVIASRVISVVPSIKYEKLIMKPKV